MKGTRPLDNDDIRLVSGCFDGTFEARNRGLFMLGVSTGGRISELLGLQIGDQRKVWQKQGNLQSSHRARSTRKRRQRRCCPAAKYRRANGHRHISFRKMRERKVEKFLGLML